MRNNVKRISCALLNAGHTVAKVKHSGRKKNILDSLLGFLIGFFFGVFAGAVGVVTHASPLDYPWIGMLIASALVFTGSWFALEAAAAFGCAGYFCGVALATVIFLLFPFGGDITALQGEIVSRIWLFLAPLLAFSNFALIPAKLFRERKRAKTAAVCGE